MHMNSSKSRAPVIPLQNEKEATEGELFIKITPAAIKLCLMQPGGSYIDLLEAGIETAKNEFLKVKHYKFDVDEPSEEREHVWYKVYRTNVTGQL